MRYSVLLLTFFCTTIAAQEVCRIYTLSAFGVSVSGTNAGSLCDSFGPMLVPELRDADAGGCGANQFNCVFDHVEVVGANGDDYTGAQCHVWYDQYCQGPEEVCDAGFNYGPSAVGANFTYVDDECPPDGCDEKAGQKQTISTLDYVVAGGNGACLGGCALTAVPLSSMVIGGSGAYQNVMYAEYTGDSCGDTDSRAGKCSSSSGKVICSGEPQENCGTINGDEVCIDAVSEENPCISFESGAVACLASVANAQPDNGTEGEVAEPTAQVREGEMVVNYYSSSVVNGSSTPVSSDPSESSGDGGEGDGDEGESENECVPGEECAGDLPDQGSAGNCDDFTACFSSFFGRVQNAPIVDAVSGVSAAFPTGSCPSWELEAFGETYALSAPMCSIWEDVAPILSAAFLFIWGWVATRIFLSA